MKLEVVTNLVSVTLLTGALAPVLTIFSYHNSSAVCATNQLMRQKSAFLCRVAYRSKVNVKICFHP